MSSMGRAALVESCGAHENDALPIASCALVAVIAPVIRNIAITAITGLPAGRGPSNSSRNSGSAIPETLGGSRAITRERVAIPGSCSI